MVLYVINERIYPLRFKDVKNIAYASAKKDLAACAISLSFASKCS